MKHGFGSQTWADGARYVGNWRLGQAFGLGQFYHINGDVFEGNF
jgi:hypothetical protein